MIAGFMFKFDVGVDYQAVNARGEHYLLGNLGHKIHAVRALAVKRKRLGQHGCGARGGGIDALGPKLGVVRALCDKWERFGQHRRRARSRRVDALGPKLGVVLALAVKRGRLG